MKLNNNEFDVFINCPFDSEYKKIFHSIVFTIIYCGLSARCSLEIDDSGQNRFDKITKLIDECKFGIHDLSRTDLDEKNRLPRFNMPLELGLFLGAKRFGTKKNKNKVCLILDREDYRYQKFISDISGQDIKSHKNSIKKVITCVRDWLKNNNKNLSIPSGSIIHDNYKIFMKEIDKICIEMKLIKRELNFNEYSTVVTFWVTNNK